MKKRNIIVIGASSGGVEAIKKVIAGLPADLEAAIFIVWHISPTTTGILPRIINKLGTLTATNASDMEDIRMGHIYIAPPDRHLLLESNRVRVTRGPKENRFRPAIDPLFRSAAYCFGTQVTGVILSGALDDGTAGLWTIKERGGIAIVQDPLEATVAAMPLNALREVKVDFTLPAAQIGAMLAKLSSEGVEEFRYRNSEENKKTELELQTVLQEPDQAPPYFYLGKLSPFSCPECNGVLSAIQDGNIIRYRCHTGHAYSAESLLAAITEKTENTIWDVMRETQETVMLLNHIGDHFAENNQPHEAAIYFQKAIDTLQRSEQVRAFLSGQEQPTEEEVIPTDPAL